VSNNHSDDSDFTNVISKQAKNFFSFGATGSIFFCAASVELMWKVLSGLHPTFQGKVVGLILSFIIVFSLAIVVPEPEGQPNAGKMRLTSSEILFGFFNAMFIFAIALGLRCL
jgi:hypothetical protein